MKDKFRENFKIAAPAAVLTVILILVISLSHEISAFEVPEYNLVQIIPMLFYPFLLCISSLLFIFVIPDQA